MHLSNIVLLRVDNPILSSSMVVQMLCLSIGTHSDTAALLYLGQSVEEEEGNQTIQCWISSLSSIL